MGGDTETDCNTSQFSKKRKGLMNKSEWRKEKKKRDEKPDLCSP